MPTQEPLTLKPRLGRLAPLADRLLGLPGFNAALARADGSGSSFIHAALAGFGISASWTDGDLARIPRQGPLIVACNHPHGGADGLVALDLLLRARPDTRVLANHLLRNVAGMRPWLIEVNPFGAAAAQNLSGMRNALRHLRAGGCLLVFPAGEVASLRPLEGAVRDRRWTPHAVRLAQSTSAAVLPLHIEGRNRAIFHAAGLLHPRLRTALLVREMLALRGKTLRLRTGKPIAHQQLAEHANEDDAAKYLRLRCELLPSRPEGQREEKPAARPLAPIAAAVAPALLRAELESLPADRCLVTAGRMRVWHFQGDELPHCLREIGRLRETAFRAVSEGSGLAADIDAFDSWYDQMVLWDDEHSAIVGGYRLGPTDRILPARGKHGLYTSTLFDFRTGFFEQMDPALEMGRSFIRPEYQRKPNALPLLWRGIGRYVVKHPRYQTLFGPVSINPEYSAASRELLLGWLRHNRAAPGLAALVRAKNPPRSMTLRPADLALLRDCAFELEHINGLVSAMEDDDKSLPTLLKHYLKLNGRLIAFNVDEAFGGCLDGLITVDLTKTDPRLLEAYLGEDGARAFLDFHDA